MDKVFRSVVFMCSIDAHVCIVGPGKRCFKTQPRNVCVEKRPLFLYAASAGGFFVEVSNSEENNHEL